MNSSDPGYDNSDGCKAFLHEHVYVNVGQIITYLLECGCNREEEWTSELFDQWEELEQDEDPDCAILREPAEFWVISDYLKRLMEKAESPPLITDYFGIAIWGRETTGQSILLDYEFQEAYKEHKKPFVPLSLE